MMNKIPDPYVLLTLPMLRLLSFKGLGLKDF